MKLYEITLTFSHNEPTTKFIEDEVETFVSNVRKLGYTLAVAQAEPEPVEEAVEDDVAVFDAPLIDRMNALQDAAANANFSQAELAEALGVSRYAVRKALKGA